MHSHTAAMIDLLDSGLILPPDLSAMLFLLERSCANQVPKVLTVLCSVLTDSNISRQVEGIFNWLLSMEHQRYKTITVVHKTLHYNTLHYSCSLGSQVHPH